MTLSSSARSGPYEILSPLSRKPLGRIALRTS